MLSNPTPFPTEPACVEPRVEDRLWRAVLARDGSFDGRFVFAVRSTRIYCRPSCPAKRPRRDRTAFYPRPEDAERAGYRACLRCEPRLFSEAQAKRRLDGELALARTVQEHLAPALGPAFPGWDVAGRMLPCREVGGDFFDVVPSAAGDRLVVGLGDVSGKGVGAALLAASLQTAFRLTARNGLSPGAILAVLNGHLGERTPPGVYATLAVVVLEAGTGCVEWSLAGHPPPVALMGRTTARWLDTGGPPLGLFEGATFAEARIDLGHSGAVLLYSDGISEATDTTGAEVGRGALARAFAETPATSAAARAESLLGRLQGHSGAAPAADDRSLVVACRTGGLSS